MAVSKIKQNLEVVEFSFSGTTDSNGVLGTGNGKGYIPIGVTANSACPRTVSINWDENFILFSPLERNTSINGVVYAVRKPN